MRAIASWACPERPPEAIRDIIGLGLRESWHRLFPELGPDGSCPFVRPTVTFLRTRAADLAALRGAAEVVAELAGRGFVLAVATGKSRRGLDRDLASTGLVRFISGSRTADETRSKPHPDMLLELMTCWRSPGAPPDGGRHRMGPGDGAARGRRGASR
jgi:phosphoglycolate phosphatase